VLSLVLFLLLLSSVAYYLGRRRAFSVAGGQIRELHSLPGYNGLYVALWCGLPALVMVAAWLSLEGGIIGNLIVAGLPQDIIDQGPDRITLVLNEIRNIVSGTIYGEPNAAVMAAAEHYTQLKSISHGALIGLTLALSLGAGAYALRKIKPRFAARNAVEGVITGLLLTSSTIAVLTTVGIAVLSIGTGHRVPVRNGVEPADGHP
jgi:phosphate transport system permease protein